MGHFLAAAAVYASAALVRLGLYLPHRAGHMRAAWEAVKRAAAASETRAGAWIAGVLRATAADRADPAAPTDPHLMSDHVLLGLCLAALLSAELGLLVADVRRGGHGRARVAALKVGIAVCVVLFALLAADMYYTALYFHARHETLAAVGAGGAVVAPVAAWLGRRRARR